MAYIPKDEDMGAISPQSVTKNVNAWLDTIDLSIANLQDWRTRLKEQIKNVNLQNQAMLKSAPRKTIQFFGKSLAVPMVFRRNIFLVGGPMQMLKAKLKAVEALLLKKYAEKRAEARQAQKQNQLDYAKREKEMLAVPKFAEYWKKYKSDYNEKHRWKGPAGSVHPMMAVPPASIFMAYERFIEEQKRLNMEPSVIKPALKKEPEKIEPQQAGIDVETIKKVLPIASGLLLIGLVFSASKRYRR